MSFSQTVLLPSPSPARTAYNMQICLGYVCFALLCVSGVLFCYSMAIEEEEVMRRQWLMCLLCGSVTWAAQRRGQPGEMTAHVAIIIDWLEEAIVIY